MDLIFTTAFKNIKRESWKDFAMSRDQYLTNFNNLINTISYTLVVYLEKETLDKITCKRPNIIFKDINEVSLFYNTYLETDKKIIESLEYKALIPEYRKTCPEHLYSEYNLINHSKINFVRHTKTLYPGYSFYPWIDFGRMNEDISNIPNNIDVSLLPSDKISYHCLMEPPTHISAKEMLKSNAVYFLGSSFIVPSSLVEMFEYMYEEKLREWYKEGISDDDQNLVLQIYYDQPYLFHKIYTTIWYGMYTTLKKKSFYNIVSAYSDWICNLQMPTTNLILYHTNINNSNYVPFETHECIVLKYIIDYYDKLSDYTFFARNKQFEWYHNGNIVDRFKESMNKNERFYNINTFELNPISDMSPESKIMKFYKENIDKFIPLDSLRNQNWPTGKKGCGQMIVHKNAILSLPLTFYKGLYDWFLKNNTWENGVFLDCTWHVLWEEKPILPTLEVDINLSIVISRYKKNVDFINRVKRATILIYDKETPTNPYNVPLNKGNEASVYLKYIIDHYDTLPEYTFFMHDDEYAWHHTGSIIDRLKEAIQTKEEYYNVNHFMLQDIKPEHFEMVEWYKQYIDPYIPYDKLANKNWVKGFKGCAQFLVHKKRILSLPKELYVSLYEWILQFKDSRLGGIYMETVWHVLWVVHYENVLLRNLLVM